MNLMKILNIMYPAIPAGDGEYKFEMTPAIAESIAKFNYTSKKEKTFTDGVVYGIILGMIVTMIMTIGMILL